MARTATKPARRKPGPAPSVKSFTRYRPIRTNAAMENIIGTRNPSAIARRMLIKWMLQEKLITADDLPKRW